MLVSLLLLLASKSHHHSFQTKDAIFVVDETGYITSIRDRKTSREYMPNGRRSPMLSLSTKWGLVSRPDGWNYNASREEFSLHYRTGQLAVVKVQAKPHYLKQQLISITNRSGIDNIIWGPVDTNISKYIGDLIGVVHDDNFAIGMMGLDDNTIAGPPVDGDCYGMGYFVHSRARSKALSGAASI